MNRLPTFFILLSCGLLLACGGGRAAQAPPDHLQPAAKALVKGVGYYRQGCYERSADLLLQAHERYTAADDRAGAATALNNIGNVYRARMEPARALLYYDAAADTFREIGHSEGRARALVNRASTLIESGRLAEAEKALADARAEDAGEASPDVAWMLAHGILLFRKGSVEAGEAELRQALERGGDPHTDVLPAVHYALGRLLLETGRAEEAASQAKAALDADRGAGAFRKTADDLLLLGSALQRAGRASEAAGAFRRAMKIYALLGDADAVDGAARQLKETGIEAVHPVTLEFVEQWLRGNLRSNICR